MSSQSKWIENFKRVAFAAFLFALPVTSFPYFPPAIGGEALVRPLALYPLVILSLFFIIPLLFHRPLPRILLSLLPFVLIALGSSLLSLLRGIEPALGVSVQARVLRALLTLGIGCAIYLVVALLPENIADLRFALRWIYAGMATALAWGSIQATYIIHFDQAWFDTLNRLQQFISIRRLLTYRISGLTYEPNWFAEQISLLLLPWLLASVFSGYSVFRRRWRWLTVELVLLIWAFVLLPFTFSRAGVMNLVVLTSFSVLFLRGSFSQRRWAITSDQPKTASSNRSWSQRLRPVMEAALLITVVATMIYWIGAKNIFFARLWKYWERQEASLTGYLTYLGFDARLAFGQAAYRTFEAYPLLGVGLGNFAFYFEEMLPDRPLALIPEVMQQVTPEVGNTRLITAKNFYLRLLAETGLVGAAAFAAFVIAILGSALYLQLSKDEEQKFWGAASLVGLVGFALSALSFDSFVIPNMWVLFGMITAATRVLWSSSKGAAGSRLGNHTRRISQSADEI